MTDSTGTKVTKVFRTWNGGWGVRGHVLEGDGAPFDATGNRIVYSIAGEPSYPSRGGQGHAKCGGCGEISTEEFETAAARRAWFQEHKRTVARAETQKNAPAPQKRNRGVWGRHV